MKVYLIRHSEPDFSQVDRSGYVGYGRELTRLTPYGVRVADKAALNPIFDKIQLLLVSPYTRTMETAMEFVKYHPEIHTQVELLLHEWRPDKSGRKLANFSQRKRAYADYIQGTHYSGLDYETPEEIKQRVYSVLDRYKDQYTCIACVTHCQVIKQIAGIKDNVQIPYCGIYEIDYD